MNAMNLALRFALEVAALIGLAAGGWSLVGGPGAWAAAIALPRAGAVAWGVFNVPGDPSRSGAAPVRVPGAVRLALEVVILGAGAAGFAIAGLTWIAVAFAVLVVLHYLASVERLRWLLAR